MNKPTLAIIVGGGPAPGINGVIGSAAIEAINNEMSVIGIYDGFSRLVGKQFDPRKDIVDLTIKSVSRIHFDGGSVLRTARASLLDERNLDDSAPVRPDPARVARVVDRLDSLGITHLLTIGGDDTALSARFVSEGSRGRIRVVHVPKTIDNDLPLPGDIPTFGFVTARHLGAQVVANLMEDSRTTQRWYLVVTMGRKAGFLALGIGKAAGATLTLIPEEFPESVTISDIADIIEGSILKRRVHGRPDGVVVLAEGLAQQLVASEELTRLLGREVPVDAAGHPRLSEIPLSRILKDEIERRFKARNQKITVVGHTLGYELRCAPPTPADMSYTRDLGHGGVTLLLDQSSDLPPGVMVTIQDSNLVPVPFEDLVDPKTNRTRIRQVILSSYTYHVARAYMIRLEMEDFENTEMLNALAWEAGMTPEQFRERYEPTIRATCPDADRAGPTPAVEESFCHCS